jgi:CheY-like chemotaxis protein
MFILVIEDDDAIRELLGQVLEDEGYVVISAADGLQALEQLEQLRELPCLILLDMMMPRMGGRRFREVQQQNPRLAHIPVVLLSARTDLRSVESAVTANEYLPKPIDLDILVSTVRRYC